MLCFRIEQMYILQIEVNFRNITRIKFCACGRFQHKSCGTFCNTVHAIDVYIAVQLTVYSKIFNK